MAVLYDLLDVAFDGLMAFRSVRNARGEIVDFVWVYTNDAALEIVGKFREEVIGNRLLSVFPGNRDSGLLDAYIRVCETGQPFDSELHYRHDGLDRWFHVRAMRITDGFCVSFSDISAGKRRELELDSVRDRFELMAHAARDGFWDYDIRTKTVWLSPRWKEQLGYLDHELPNHPTAWDGIIFPEDKAIAQRAAQDILEGRANRHEVTLRFRHRTGYTVWILSRATLLHDRDGQPARLVGVHTDITELKRLEQAWAKAEQQLRGAIDAMTDGFLLFDAEDRIVLINEQFRRLYPRIAPHLEPGMHFEDILRLGVELGQWAEDPGTVPPESEVPITVGTADHWLADKRRRHRQLGHTHTIRLADRRIIRILEHPTPDGGVVSIHSDISLLHQQSERLKEQTQFFEKVVDLLPINIFIRDSAGRYLLVNRQGAEAIGLTKPEIIGRSSLDILQPSVAKVILDDDREVMEQDRGYTFRERDLLRKDGTSSTHLTFKQPMELDGRKIVLSASVDIAERKQYELELQRSRADLDAQRQRAEAASRAKSEFLAMMSHELRTPLTGILGMVDLLQTTSLSITQRDYLRTLRGSADALLKLLNDILDMTKLEADRLTLEQIDFSVDVLVREVVALFDAPALRDGTSLRVEFAPDLPLRVRGDPTRLRQVLLNIVGNAVKFTRQGRVDIRVSREETEQGLDPVLRFEVADTGIGITEDQLRRIFEPFAQADASITRQFGGTGLGLAISCRLVEAMGGAIQVESTPGEGSRFWFTIRVTPPVRQLPHRGGASQDADVKQAAETEEQWGASGVRILVAEDNEVTRTLLRTMLERDGHRVQTVPNGRAAVELLTTSRFDLVILDRRMPLVEGPIAARMIRALPAPLCDVPIIGLTADVDGDQQAEFLAAGVDRVVGKPIDWLRLTDAVEDSLARHRHGTAAAESARGGMLVDDKRLRDLEAEIGPLALASLWSRLGLTVNRTLDQLVPHGVAAGTQPLATGQPMIGWAEAMAELAELCDGLGAVALAAAARSMAGHTAARHADDSAALRQLAEDSLAAWQSLAEAAAP